MAQGVSEIVGRADGPGGSGVTVYRALKPLLCAPCGEPIGEGTLFTRRGLPGLGSRIPRCRECAPFDLLAGGDQEQPRPALLESLLTPRPEPNETRVRDSDAEKEAVERRLGPALRRCRRRTRS